MGIANITNNILTDSGAVIGAANGVATLDSGGKIPVTQLPNSVMEFKGTWSAATNTPTLANGTGNAGDVYEVSAAGTVNFGAGGIAFALGDYVVYDGATWQYSSGQKGTITSVALTVPSAFSVSGSPITTSGTLAITGAGNGTQYIDGTGALQTFPVAGQSGTLVREVRNATGATLTKGTIVYISGATGNKPTVSKAIATGDSTSAQTFGMLQADIANNANGYAVCTGDLSGLDTSALTEGQQLYLSGVTAGAYTTTKSVAPIHLVYIGVVTRSHPTLGQIEVKIQNGYELDEIHDVLITSKANNDGLFYESSTSLWKNKTIATVLGYTPANGANYLPLAGGTMTGMLNGKTFVFTTSTNSAFAGVVENLGTTDASGLIVNIGASSTGTPFRVDKNSSALFTVANSGAVTLTGALSGTSATFSGQVNAASKHTWGSATNGTTGQIATDGTNNYFDYIGSLVFRGAAASNTLVTFTNAGAATFSSSVTAGAGLASGNALVLSNGTNARQFQLGYSTGAGYNYFQVYDGAAFQPMMINNSLYVTGTNVGIGTTSPTLGKLQVEGSGGDTTLSVNNTTTNAAALYLTVYTSGTLVSSGRILQDNSGNMRFNTGTSSDTERMRITSGGNVGIGTSSFSDVAFGSPTLKVYGSRATLGLNSTGSLTTIAMVAASDTTKAIHINQESNGALKIYQYSAAAETFVLSAAGNLLVGTSTDSGFKLDVVGSGRFNGGATTDVLKIQSTGANADLWLYDSGTTAGNVRLRSVSNSLILISGGLSSLTLSSAGAATFYSSVSATSFFETSDKTVKTLIQDNVLIKGIEKVTAKTYLKNNKEEIGYFAQDLQGVLDSSINVGEKGLLSLSYTQVHTAKIAVAESEIDKLKKRVAELEQQLNLN